MFIMTSDITIGKYTAIKPASVKWKTSVSSFVDTCVISLPLRTYTKALSSGTDDVTNKESGLKSVFSEGDAVDVLLGYDGVNTRRFKGFVDRINYAMPLELQCEGYSYQLKRKMFNKSYKSTTVKGILTDLIEGTDILLSTYNPDITLKNVVFKNVPGLKVLEWFQKECSLCVFFDYDTLYVGASRYGIPKATQKLRLGWNTVEDKDLKKTIASVITQINVVEKTNKGETKKTKSAQSKYDNIEQVKVRGGMSESLKKEIADELQRYKNFSGYQGNVRCFLTPEFEPGMVAEITDKRFTDREGSYFIEEVDGSFDSSGGRQTITLRYYGRANTG